MIIVAFWCAIFFEMLFLLLYRNARRRYKKLKGTGRIHEIAYTKNWEQFFKILLISLPILLLLFVNDTWW
jgi:hypothetical protein